MVSWSSATGNYFAHLVERLYFEIVDFLAACDPKSVGSDAPGCSLWTLAGLTPLPGPSPTEPIGTVGEGAGGGGRAAIAQSEQPGASEPSQFGEQAAKKSTISK